MSVTRCSPVAATLALLVAVCGFAPAAHAQLLRAKHDRGILRVPFVGQQDELCAAAAPAMLLRYWGAAHAAPDDLAASLECTARGFAPEALTAALQRHGWRTEIRRDQDSALDKIRDELRHGHPVIVMLADRLPANHYAVVIGATEDDVVLQDPVHGPYQVVAQQAFDEVWAPAHRWMLVVTPAGATSPPSTMPPAASATAGSSAPLTESTTSCADLIAASLRRVADDRPAAERGLHAATELCADDPVAWRELANLRFLDSKWKAAEKDAHRAVDLNPEDKRAWDLLARSRYYSGEVLAALRSWNEIGRPVTGSVEVHNTRHTDPKIVADLIGIAPGEVLTNDKFIRALHRLDQLPVSFDTRLKYASRDDGTAKVDVYVEERDVVPAGPIPITVVGVGGLVFQDVRFDIAGPSGHAEDVNFSWNWEHNWRHLRLGLDVPAPGKLPGIATIDAFWENQVYAPTPDAQVSAERRHLSVALSDWASSWMWWQLGVAADRFGQQNYGAVNAALEGRFIRDHVAVNAEAGSWFGNSMTPAFSSGSVWVSTRSTTRADRRIWLTVFGTAATGDNAPYQLWAGAGSSEAGNAYLRAHPLISRGIVTGEVFGRRVDFGSVEFDHPVYKSSAGPIALALFVDGARARDRAANQPDTPTFVDVGVGFRLHPPGVSGVLRLDIAHSVTDGRTRVSIGMLQKWPKR